MEEGDRPLFAVAGTYPAAHARFLIYNCVSVLDVNRRELAELIAVATGDTNLLID